MNEKKAYINIADLLTDDSFLTWHFRKDDRYDMIWNEWVAAKPEHAQLATQAAQLLAVFIGLKEQKLSEYQVNTSVERLLKKITNKENKLYSIL